MENLGQGLGSVGKAHAFCISFICDVLSKIIAILELSLLKFICQMLYILFKVSFKVGAEQS